MLKRCFMFIKIFLVQTFNPLPKTVCRSLWFYIFFLMLIHQSYLQTQEMEDHKINHYLLTYSCITIIYTSIEAKRKMIKR